MVLIVNIVGIAVILWFVQSRTITPELNVVGFKSFWYDGSPPYVTAEGTVFNPGPLTANNVSLLVEVYVRYIGPRGVDMINSTDIEMGTIPVNSSRYFNVGVSYPDSRAYVYYSSGYDVLFASGIGFGLDSLAGLLPMVITLAIANVYIAHRVGFFTWVTAKRKVVATTIGWSFAIALVMIVAYWLVYVQNPLLVSQRIAASDVYAPELNVWDCAMILIVSAVAGAIIVDLEDIIYDFIAAMILSFAIALLYASFFIWFVLGMGDSLSITTGGITFLGIVQLAIQAALVNIFKMMLIVPLLSLLGVFIGAFVVGYLRPYSDVQTVAGVG